MAALSGKLTKKLVKNLGAGRRGDGNGVYLVVDPSGARRWIVRVVVKGQRGKTSAPLRTDFGLGGADIVTLNQARGTVVAAAEFHGTQTGEGPPIAPTGKAVVSDYANTMQFDGGKISHMTKIRNDVHALHGLGWA